MDKKQSVPDSDRIPSRQNEANLRLGKIRHSLAHILAMAVLEKFPNAKLGIGPVIENGFYYDFKLPRPIAPHELSDIEKRMQELVRMQLGFTGHKITPMKAKTIFKSQPFKIDLIKEFTKEKKQLMVYTTSSKQQQARSKREKNLSVPATSNQLPVTSFTDLCRGGHVENTSEIDHEGFMLDKVAGAYWRGDEKNPQLTRIYGLAFANKKELDAYLAMREEAKKRDHRIIGKNLKLFTFSDEVGPGLPLWLPNGTILRDEIENYAKEVERQWGYQRVTTPHIAKESLYRMSGHIPYYTSDMYPPMALDDGNYYLKAMNCPHTHMIYKSEPRSYRDLPLRFAEYGTVYRYELSGVLTGLLRVRGFTQNDAHIYCREDQVEEEFLKVMKLHEFWYRDVFGIKDFYMRLSLPAKDKSKYVNVPEGWKKSVEMVRKIMKKSGLPYVKAEGEAAFYGPKVDFQIKSVIGKEETASTNQLDFLATQRFNLTYTDKDGSEKSIYVIHRAPLGSHERFIAFLIEHYAGAFPLWLAPEQVRILPVSEKFLDYAEKVVKMLREKNIRVTISGANETLGKRIREAQLMKIPYTLVVGEKEMTQGTVSVRHMSRGNEGVISIKNFEMRIQDEIGKKT